MFYECVGSTGADNVPDLIAPNETVTFQEINNRIVSYYVTFE